MNSSGDAFSFTGSGCHAWAGGRAARAQQGMDGGMAASYAVQGNILAVAHVVDAIAETFEQGSSLVFPERLLTAIGGIVRGSGEG